MNDIFTQQQLDALEKHGYIESHAGEKSAHFKEMLVAYIHKFPKVKYTVGTDKGIGEIVYLPKARRRVLSLLTQRIREHESIVRKLYTAVDMIETT